MSDEDTRRGRIEAAYRAAADHEARLVTRLIGGIRAIPGTTVHGITDPERVAERVPTGVADPRAQVAGAGGRTSGARRGLCVVGAQLRLEVVRHLGIDEATGVIRIGLAHYNTEAEVEATLAALEGVLR